jgi:hypothetical protein
MIILTVHRFHNLPASSSSKVSLNFVAKVGPYRDRGNVR